VNTNRREVIRAAGFLGAAGATGLGGITPAFAAESMTTRAVPSTGEEIPVIGLGTYEVFDVAGSDDEINVRGKIVQALADAGGKVIDTSPMYNRSEAVIGKVLRETGVRNECFLATKVWIDGEGAGEQQMRRSAALMQTDSIDLMQVHNRRDIDAHWPNIRDMQASGFIRYNGITDFRDSAHDEMERLMRAVRPDFIQINYSLGERNAENSLLPLAEELGIAVLINRPFMAGRLFRAVGDAELPDWATPFAESWGQFFLKFIVSHPAVTCAIPATSKLRHMRDNAQAGTGLMPDAADRRRMIDFFEGL